MNCKHCEKELKVDGVQYDAIKSVAYTLASCTNPECIGYQSTFGGDVRPMTTEERDRYADFRARLGIK